MLSFIEPDGFKDHTEISKFTFKFKLWFNSISKGSEETPKEISFILFPFYSMQFATKKTSAMFVKSPSMLLVMSIGLFAFGVGFGFVAFPKFLRHMIKSVSECNFIINSVILLMFSQLQIPLFPFNFHFPKSSANQRGERFRPSPIVRKNAVFPEFPLLHFQYNKQR